MEIRGVGSYVDISAGATTSAIPHQALSKDAPAERTSQEQANMEKALSDLQKIAQAFDTRLEFSMDRDINRVIVKVIDAHTDKVIRELPPKAIQELYRRIREVVGLLFDHKV
jgi:flagellar protein FlaG